MKLQHHILLCCIGLLILMALLIWDPTWMRLALMCIFVFVMWRTLFRTYRIIVAGARVLSHPTPGDWSNFTSLGRAIVDSRIRVYGAWPKEPVIFVVNYPTEVLEYTYLGWAAGLYPLTVIANAPPKTWNGRFLSNPLEYLRACKLKEGVNYIARLSTGHSFETIKKQIAEHVHQRGRSMWIYPETNAGVQRRDYMMRELRNGVFVIAQELCIPVVPIAIGRLSCAMEIPFIIGPQMKTDAKLMRREASIFFDNAMQRLAYLDQMA